MSQMSQAMRGFDAANYLNTKPPPLVDVGGDPPLNQIIHGDCIEVIRGWPDACVRLCFADPPYNNGTEYAGYNDQRDDYEQWCGEWFSECRRVAERVIITPGQGNLWMWGRIEKPWGVGCWFKPGNSAGSVLGKCDWEPWLFYSKDYKALGGTDTIRATVSKQKGVGNHPCPKPLELLRRLIVKTTKANDIVLDPFIGSGTTAVACVLEGRFFVGIEQATEYVETARERVAKAKFEPMDGRPEFF